MSDERFDIDVGYNDPQDPRDPEPEDKPSPAEYEDDLVERVAHAIEDAYLNTVDRFDAFNEFRAAARAAIAAMEKDR